MLEQGHDLCIVNLHMCVHDKWGGDVFIHKKRKAKVVSYTTNHFSVEILWVSVVKVG